MHGSNTQVAPISQLSTPTQFGQRISGLGLDRDMNGGVFKYKGEGNGSID